MIASARVCSPIRVFYHIISAGLLLLPVTDFSRGITIERSVYFILDQDTSPKAADRHGGGFCLASAAVTVMCQSSKLNFVKVETYDFFLLWMPLLYKFSYIPLLVLSSPIIPSSLLQHTLLYSSRLFLLVPALYCRLVSLQLRVPACLPAINSLSSIVLQ